MALSSSNAVRQLSDGNSLGTVYGQSATDLIGFYGMATSGVAVGASTVIGVNYATSIALAINATTASVTTWAFGSSTQANAVIGLLDWAYRAGVIR
jgi:hypothetical protein